MVPGPGRCLFWCSLAKFDDNARVERTDGSMGIVCSIRSVRKVMTFVECGWAVIRHLASNMAPGQGSHGRQFDECRRD